MDMQDTQLTRIFTNDPKWARNIGENLARRVETTLGYPKFWLDQDHDLPAPGARTLFIATPEVLENASGTAWTVDSGDPVTAYLTDGPRAYGYRVSDTAMTSGMFGWHEGDVVIVDPDSPPKNGALVVYRLPTGDIVMRQYARQGDTLRLAALNESLYPPISLAANEGYYLGRVTEAPAKAL